MCISAKVDQKGRLKIPVPVLPALREPGAEFYITSEDGYSVRIYWLPVWNQVEEGLERLCSRDRNHQKLLVRAKYFGRVVTMDKQGRLLIPNVLRSSAQMNGAVDVLDYVNYLEVWNHARLMKSLKSTPITAQDEKTLNDLSSAPQFPWAGELKKKDRSMEENGDSWCTAECMEIHAVNRDTRFEALEPIRLGVRAWPDRFFVPSGKRVSPIE